MGLTLFWPLFIIAVNTWASCGINGFLCFQTAKVVWICSSLSDLTFLSPSPGETGWLYTDYNLVSKGYVRQQTSCCKLRSRRHQAYLTLARGSNASKRAHDVVMASFWRRCDIITWCRPTSVRRHNDAIYLRGYCLSIVYMWVDNANRQQTVCFNKNTPWPFPWIKLRTYYIM